MKNTMKSILVALIVMVMMIGMLPTAVSEDVLNAENETIEEVAEETIEEVAEETAEEVAEETEEEIAEETIEEVAEYKLTINYVDQDLNPLPQESGIANSTITLMYAAGAEYTVYVPELEGYISDYRLENYGMQPDNDNYNSYKGVMPEEDLTVYVSYIALGGEGLVEENIEDYETPLAGEPEAAELPVNRSIWISSTLGDVVYAGEAIYLTSVLTGYDGLDISFQWQYNNGAGWNDVSGANSDSYTFYADAENISYSWRLVVTIHN